MSARRLALVFAIALALLLPALLPLRVGLRLAGADDLGLRAADAGGSVWRGRLRDARFRGQALGDVEVRLAFLPLLAGTRRLVLSAEGARLAIQSGRRSGVLDARGVFAVDDPAILPGSTVTVRADGVTIVFGRDGCDTAEGRIEATLGGGTDTTALATLAGEAACAGPAAVVALAPATAATPPFNNLRVELRIEADGSYQVQSRLSGAGSDAPGPALQAYGFQPGPGGWSRYDEGRLLAD